MTSKTTTQKVPRLRFRECSDEWIEKKFGEVFSRTTRRNTENNTNVLTISAQRGLVNQEDYFNKSVAARNLTGYYLLHKGDFAYNKSYSKGYPMGAIKRLDSYPKGIVSTLYICFTINENNSAEFMVQYFEAGLQNHEIEKIAQEGARNHGLLNIGVTDFFENVLLKLPTKAEQEKIAGFLTEVDDKISALQNKKQLLQKFKKGVMQAIFSQKIRFKDENGKDYPDWQEKTLRDIATKENSTIAVNELGDRNGEYNVFGASGVAAKIDTYEQEKPYLAIIKDGAGVGRLNKYEARSSVLGTLTIVKPKQGTDLGFLHFLLQQINFKRYVIGSTIPHIYFKDYSKERVAYPTLPEQQKIASFLDELNDKINLEESKLEQAEKFKKALLQQMFV